MTDPIITIDNKTVTVVYLNHIIVIQLGSEECIINIYREPYEDLPIARVARKNPIEGILFSYEYCYENVYRKRHINK